jgi:hypothetical protein
MSERKKDKSNKNNIRTVDSLLTSFGSSEDEKRRKSRKQKKKTRNSKEIIYIYKDGTKETDWGYNLYQMFFFF